MGHYLVTGAAGFIGAHVVQALLEAGHRVLGIDNLNDAYDPRLKRWRLGQLRSNPDLEFREIDICDLDSLSAAWEPSFEAVINLAARAGVRASVKDPHEYVRTNVLGTLNLLELCRQRGPGKFVQASTSSLYGKHNERPFREDADISRPLSPYTASKGASELLCHSYHSLYGLDISVLRYFTVYGPAGRPDMSIFRFVQWIAEDRPVIIYGDGRQERDFTYIGDIARGTLAALRPLGYEVINLGSDQPWDLLEIVRQIESLLGKQARLEHHQAAVADVPATQADIDKAGQLLHWEPYTALAEGLERTVQWYLGQRDWASQIDTSDD